MGMQTQQKRLLLSSKYEVVGVQEDIEWEIPGPGVRPNGTEVVWSIAKSPGPVKE